MKAELPRTAYTGLQPGENLIWKGKPGKQSAPAGKSVAAVTTGLVIAAAAVWITMYAPEGLPEWMPEGIADILSSLFVRAGLLLFAAACLLYPVIIRKILSTTTYIVTDRRLVSCTSWLGAEKGVPIPYEDVDFVRISPQRDSLNNVYVSIKPELDAMHQTGSHAYVFMYLPDDVAEYIRSVCHDGPAR